MTLTVAPVTGAGLTEVIPALAALRIAVFRDFPYLYDGDAAYEAAYLASFAAADGAVDNAAGTAVVMEAARILKAMNVRPKRTIRFALWNGEEQGLHGGKAYAAKHLGDIARHQIAAESDFGAGRIYAFNTGAPDHARKATEQIAQALAPLGIEYAPGKGSAGPDISPFAAKGMAWAWLAQDGSDYFDLHHNADDTLDKIDPAALAQNVAAYAVFAYLAAEADGDFGSQLKE